MVITALNSTPKLYPLINSRYSKMKLIGVYLLTDIKSKRFYVGSSGDIKKRLERHFYDLNRNQHHCSELQNLWWKNKGLTTSIFPTITREEAYELEKDIITRFSTSDIMLNIGLGIKGGDNLSRNKKRDEILLKIKNSVKERMSILTSDERKVLFGLSGQQNGMWGKTHSIETRSKMSEFHRTRPRKSGYKLNLSDQRRKEISELAKKRTGELNPFFNKTHSQETKNRISEKKKSQNLLPPNTRKVKIEDKVFESLTEASRQLGVSPALILYKIKSEKEKYSNYCYLT